LEDEMSGPLDTFRKTEAKDWAREHMRGVCNALIPSFTSDLSGLNEAGIRHDIRRNIELGFWGALLVSETATTKAEMRRFMEIAADEAGGRHYLALHGSFDTAEDVIEMADVAHQLGIHAMLLSYPTSFYPRTPKDVVEYTRRICESVDLGVILFAASQWNFDRLDPRGYPADALVELASIPNVVAVKYEVSKPGVVGTYETFQKLKPTNVLVCDPFEGNAPVWAEVFGMQWLGTSNYECYGDSVPRMIAALNGGRRAEAMDIYWRIQPARAQRFTEQATYGGANYVHRYLWKYQAWLTGYNGGPLRSPGMKIVDAQMRRMADAMCRVGVITSYESFDRFYVGRNPA
jgi:dihydrodipicolinate synthase/N-acetylneuraminate lyase